MSQNNYHDLELARFEESAKYPKVRVRTSLFASQNLPVKQDDDGALAINVQDQTTEPISLYLCKNNGTTTASVAGSIDDKSVTVADATGAAAYDCIEIIDNGRVFQSLVSAVDGNVVSFLSPCDMDFDVGATVSFGEWDAGTVDGSVTPVILNIQPPEGVVWDITKVNISITDGSAMDDGLFGGLTQLTNGIVLRVCNGYDKNLWLISNNAGFREYGAVTQYSTRAPAGKYGFSAIKTFAGQGNNGVALRLHGDTADCLQLIIQDDLTDLTKFSIVAEGHVVQ